MSGHMRVCLPAHVLCVQHTCSQARHVLVLVLLQVEGVWLQDFSSQVPGQPDIGPCVVIQGRQPCCGLVPAAHMTPNPHIALPLRALSKVCARVCCWCCCRRCCRRCCWCCCRRCCCCWQAWQAA